MSIPLIPATKEEEKRIYAALNVEEDRHYRLVEVFKEWVQSTSYLPNNLDEEYLSIFLALCKDDLVKAKRKFETTIIGRRSQSWLNYETFLTPEDYAEQKMTRGSIVLPKLTKDCHRVVYMSFPYSKNYNQKKHLQYYVTIGDTILFEDKASGLVVIFDFVGCTLEIVSKIDLAVLAKLVIFYLHAMPTPVKKIHIMNAPAIAKPILTVVKTGLPAKVRNRLIVHNNVQDLKNYLDDEFIPVDYGGSHTCLDELAKQWETYYLENKEWKSKMKKLRARGEIPKEKLHLDPSYGFGSEGSFRNLEVD